MLIGNKAIKESTIRTLIAAIRSKKELQHLNEEFIHEHIQQYLTQHPKAAALLAKGAAPGFSTRSAHYKKIIKDVRASLRKVYGLFRTREQELKRKELLEELSVSPAHLRSICQAILDTHPPTRERLPFYENFYRKLFRITGEPSSILDLGCGLNPFSLVFMKAKTVTYYAYDIDEEEISLLNKFFAQLHKHNPAWKGRADILDLLHWARLSHLKKMDLCFLLKMTDVLDRGKGHKATEAVIRMVPAGYVVVSFPTLTMSGRKMNVPQRRWIEWMCRRLGYGYAVLEFETEIFYVLNKEKKGLKKEPPTNNQGFQER